MVGDMNDNSINVAKYREMQSNHIDDELYKFLTDSRGEDEIFSTLACDTFVAMHPDNWHRKRTYKMCPVSA